MTATMIGVVHRDPRGYERLLVALDNLRPATITLEVSPYAVEFRETRADELRRRLDAAVPPGKENHGQIEAIRETLAVPFEVRAAREYAVRHQADFALVDDSDLSRGLLAELADELLTPENVGRLAQEADVPLSRTVDSFYRRARRLREDEPVPPALAGFSPERLALLDVRDEQMEIRIRDFLAAHPARPWVHVGGVFHLLRVRGLRLLWERFADEDVARVFLDEFD